MNAANSGRPWRVSCFALAALIGMMVPLGEGCTPCPGVAAAYLFREQPNWWVRDSGRLDVTDTAMLISYTAAEDGSKWTIEYRRVENPDWVPDGFPP